MKKLITLLAVISPLVSNAWTTSDEYEIGVSQIVYGHYIGYTTPIICDWTNVVNAPTVLNGTNGAKGDKGDKGDTGPIGMTGPTITSTVVYTNWPINTVSSNGTGFNVVITSSFTVTPSIITGNASQVLMVSTNGTGGTFRPITGQGSPSLLGLLLPTALCSWSASIHAGDCFYMTNQATGLTTSAISASTNTFTYIP